MKYFMGLCLLVLALGSQATPVDLPLTTTVSPMNPKSLNDKLVIAVLVKDDINEVRNLVQLGADVNFIFASQNLLVVPSSLGRINMVKCLVELGINVNANVQPNALWFASTNGHLEIVKYLVEHNADVNVGSEGTPLLKASSNGYLEIVKYLLEHNADVNAKDDFGNTALDLALTYDHTEIARLLKNAGGKAIEELVKYEKLFPH